MARIELTVGREVELTPGDWQKVIAVIPTVTEGQATVETPTGTYGIWVDDHKVREAV